MKVGLRLSFQKNSLNGAFFSNVFNQYVKFAPFMFTKKYKTYPWDSKKHLKIIASDNSGDTLSVTDRDGNIFYTGKTGTKNSHRSVLIEQEDTFFLPDNDEIEKIIDYGGFVSCYLYNEEYAYVQSQVSENNLSGRSFSKEVMDSIKKTPYKIDGFGRVYDVRFNPGRLELIGYTWIMAAWKMWFGKPFFELVSKERILSFPYATEIKELPTGQIFVQLYEEIEHPYTPDNVFRQTKWWEWLNYDELIEKYP